MMKTSHRIVTKEFWLRRHINDSKTGGRFSSVGDVLFVIGPQYDPNYGSEYVSVLTTNGFYYAHRDTIAGYCKIL